MPRTIKSGEAIAHAKDYQKRNFANLTVTVPRATADQFRRWCAENGTTAHAEIKKFVESRINKAQQP